MTVQKETEEIITGVGSAQGWPLRFFRPFGMEWARWEGTKAKYNPLATTQKWANSTDFNDNGGFPVQNYATIEDGIAATVETLNNGYYPNLCRAIADGNIGHYRSDVIKELTTWGTVGFADLIAGGWNPTLEPEPEPAPAVTLDSVYAYCNALNDVLGKVLRTLQLEPNLKYTYAPIDASQAEGDTYEPRPTENASQN